MAGAKDSYFFEGTEKLLEVWFSPNDEENNKADLRDISRKQWDELLRNVHCNIISETRNDDMVAYILSESSMFVSKRRFILKTCGTTTLLAAIKPLLKLVKETCAMDKVDDIFFSRKKFMKPQLQDKIHQNFDDEVVHLDELFSDGAAYVMGRINRDCWYLYTIDKIGVEEPDQTLELLMTGMDVSVMNIFNKDISADGADATARSGIADLLPGAVIDAFLFDPCGYSMNGILPNDQYFTIHVTPEAKFSYVSFETNIPKESYDSLVHKILDIFKPKAFLMTIFANKASVAAGYYRSLENALNLNDYTRNDHQFSQLKNYNLTYSYFSLPEKKLSGEPSAEAMAYIPPTRAPVPDPPA